MSSSELAISVRGLSKAYTIRHNANDHVTVAELALDRVKHPFRRTPREEFWALKDVDFDVHKGEVRGVIGRNGAGKSTLLKVLTRITEPTRGRIDLWGRVGSLLEVGTGFHPELSGRENVYLNGSILGMTRKEITKQFDAIVDFAGVEKFLDTPVKRYSSGMYVRLAFAVAAHLESEILLIDEVLAVGDGDFQSKCLGKISELAESGRTVLIVSHSAHVITELAPRTLLLQAGRVEADAVTPDVLRHYRESDTEFVVSRELSQERRRESALGSRARVDSIEMLAPSNSLGQRESLQYLLAVTATEDLPAVTVSQSIHTPDGTKIGSCFAEHNVPVHKGSNNIIEVALRPTPLAPGRYYISVGLGLGDNRGNATFLDIVDDAIRFEIRPTTDQDGNLERWDDSWGPVHFSAAAALNISAPPSFERTAFSAESTYHQR